MGVAATRTVEATAERATRTSVNFMVVVDMDWVSRK
jgi:hypothetical protein